MGDFLAIIAASLPVLGPVLEARLACLGIDSVAMNAGSAVAIYEEIDARDVVMDLVDHRREIVFLGFVEGMTAATVSGDLFQAIDLAVPYLVQELIESKIDVADHLCMAGDAPLGKLVSDRDACEGYRAGEGGYRENAGPSFHISNPLPISTSFPAGARSFDREANATRIAIRDVG
jgi:hypothetical protein